MEGQRFTPERIIGLLRQAEVELAQGKWVGEVCRGLGISEQSCYRWRSEYGGVTLERARRMKELDKENGRLKKASAGLTLDKQILKEALEGNFQAPNAAASACGHLALATTQLSLKSWTTDRGQVAGGRRRARELYTTLACEPRPKMATSGDASSLGRSAACGDFLLIDENFHPAVAPPPARRAVVGDRLARAV